MADTRSAVVSTGPSLRSRNYRFGVNPARPEASQSLSMVASAMTPL